MSAERELESLIKHCESLVGELRMMMEWARELPSQFLDGDPEVRIEFVADLKRARTVIDAAENEISELKKDAS